MPSTSTAHAAAPMSTPSSAILQELHSFREMGRVLYVAAHPDDENTRLIAYLARGRGYATGYLSLTRGDGGQNLIGPELRDALGVIRTQELLAARRVDGGRQFFSRANDFGFSKNYEETLSVWNRDEVLADMIRVIRTFRPDVLVTRFSPEPGGTHGHHTSSAILALEALKLAADPNAYRAELGALPPWQAKRVLWNSWPARMRGSSGDNAKLIELDVGGFNPLLGESYGEIAARSRTMHKSQGFGSVGTRGAALEYFTVIAGEPASTDIMDGVDTTWARIPGAAEIGRLADAAITAFRPEQPAESVPALLAIRARLAALPKSDHALVIADKRRQLDGIIVACLGLHVETLATRAEFTPGEALPLTHTIIVRNSSPVPLRWVGVRLPAVGEEVAAGRELAVNRASSVNSASNLPPDTPLTQPYWLRAEGTTGMFRVDDPALIGRPENPPAVPVEHVFEISGQTLVVADEPVQVIDDPVKGELRRRLDVVPPVTLGFVQDLELFAPGASRPVAVEVTSARAGAQGTLRLELPEGWRTSPATMPFEFKAAGDRARFSFTVTAPARPATASIVASAEIDGQRFRNRRIEIRYDHIPLLLLQPLASLKAVSLELAIRGKRVGYLPGAGDLVGESLARMGYMVTPLTAADLTVERLQAFDAVVLGVRAFNTRTDLVPQLPALFAYAEAGGNVIVQYNTTADLKTTTLAPYELHLSRDRVTDERAVVKLLAPDHPALTRPNRITPADFDGWVQERGLYFPDRWDDHFTPLLAMADPGEAPGAGSLLVSTYGRGHFVYTGLSWFRQLPEGVPGAYRLFANLISLGKE
ncbi:MAG TPA: PIG-L family deacetylase [Opitutaceae bacterium]